MGLVAPRHVGSSRTRALTRVPCIGRQILNHCATSEAPASGFYKPSTGSSKYSLTQCNRNRNAGCWWLFPHSPTSLSKENPWFPCSPTRVGEQFSLNSVRCGDTDLEEMRKAEWSVRGRSSRQIPGANNNNNNNNNLKGVEG